MIGFKEEGVKFEIIRNLGTYRGNSHCRLLVEKMLLYLLEIQNIELKVSDTIVVNLWVLKQN